MFGAGVRMFQTSVWFNYIIYFLSVLSLFVVSKRMMVFNWFICLG